jgi:predicted acyltransferase
MGWLSAEMMSTARLKSSLVRDLLAAGVMCGFAGLAWDLFFPINKKLWTSSYVLYAGGLSMIFLAASIWLIDIKKWRKGLDFFLVFGANSLFAYLLSEVLLIFWYNITWQAEGGQTNVQEWIYQSVFQKIDAGEWGSFLFAISYMLLCWLVCRYLYVRKIWIKL